MLKNNWYPHRGDEGDWDSKPSDAWKAFGIFLIICVVAYLVGR